MAELNSRISIRIVTLFLLIGVLTAIVLLVLRLQEIIETVAAKHCPPDTFMSGPVHNLWVHWMIAPVAIGPLFIALTGIARVFPAIQREGRIPLIESRQGLAIALSATAVTGLAYWVAASSLFCVTPEQIMYRDTAWQAFKTVQWSDVTQIDVDCRNGGKAPDLYYVLSTSNGVRLDLAGAENFRVGFSDLSHQLAKRPLKFNAKVAPNCPDWYRNWVGNRPE